MAACRCYNGPCARARPRSCSAGSPPLLGAAGARCARARSQLRLPFAGAAAARGRAGHSRPEHACQTTMSTCALHLAIARVHMHCLLRFHGVRSHAGIVGAGFRGWTPTRCATAASYGASTCRRGPSHARVRKRARVRMRACVRVHSRARGLPRPAAAAVQVARPRAHPDSSNVRACKTACVPCKHRRGPSHARARMRARVRACMRACAFPRVGALATRRGRRVPAAYTCTCACMHARARVQACVRLACAFMRAAAPARVPACHASTICARECSLAASARPRPQRTLAVPAFPASRPSLAAAAARERVRPMAPCYGRAPRTRAQSNMHTHTHIKSARAHKRMHTRTRARANACMHAAPRVRRKMKIA